MTEPTFKKYKRRSAKVSGLFIQGKTRYLQKERVSGLKDLLDMALEELARYETLSQRYTPQQMQDFGHAFRKKLESNVKALEDEIKLRHESAAALAGQTPPTTPDTTP